MTMKNDDIAAPLPNALSLPKIDYSTLQAFDFHFAQALPFTLELAKGEVVFINKIVRLMPRRRLVAFGTWQGKPVAAKLFYDPHHAARHFNKEAGGIKKLQKNNVPAPQVYYQGQAKDSRIHVILYEHLLEAKSLHALQQDKKNTHVFCSAMERAVVELATQHVFGLLQEDIHFDNFLISEQTVYTLDGAQIKSFPSLLAKETSLNHLALFLSQLGAGESTQQKQLFTRYAKARGWLTNKMDIVQLFFLINKFNRQRWLQFRKKIFRNATDFSKIKTKKMTGMYRRSCVGPEFLNFLNNPESAFSQPGSILKNGGSSTVVKIQLDGREWVVKRYNLKSNLHYFRRCLRKTRAWTAWYAAQKLKFFNIATPLPAAFLEKKCLGLRGLSYFISEYVPGKEAGKYFIDTAQKNKSLLLTKIITLLKKLAEIDMTHGDLKLSNILIDTQNQPFLIDLDNASEHPFISSLHYSWKKEIQRFLRNFKAWPLLYKKVQHALLD